MSRSTQLGRNTFISRVDKRRVCPGEKKTVKEPGTCGDAARVLARVLARVTWLSERIGWVVPAPP